MCRWFPGYISQIKLSGDQSLLRYFSRRRVRTETSDARVDSLPTGASHLAFTNPVSDTMNEHINGNRLHGQLRR